MKTITIKNEKYALEILKKAIPYPEQIYIQSTNSKSIYFKWRSSNYKLEFYGCSVSISNGAILECSDASILLSKLIENEAEKFYDVVVEDRPKFEVWKPEYGELVYLRGNYGYKQVSFNTLSPKYSVFKEIESAHEYHEKSLFNYEVEMFIKEKNEGWKPNWKSNERKYYIFYSHISEKLEYSYHQSLQYISNNKYFKNSIVFDELIAKFGNEKLLKWWI